MLKFKGLSEFKEFIKGRKVVIMGLGLQGGGVDSAIFFARLNANVVVTDLKSSHELKNSIKQLGDFENITFVLGQHRKQDFETADLVVKNHKIKWSNKFLKLAESRKAIIINGIDLFFTLVNTENIIGVTGTRGKTTVTTMVYNFLKTKKNTYLLGNLPNSKNLQTLFELKQSDWVVMELSSWMLSGLHRVKKSPKFAVFTSFYPDHLDYYSSMDEYFYDKSAIFSYQKPEDFLIANKQIINYLEKYKVKSRLLYYDKKDFNYKLKYLKGQHNKTNSAGVYKLLVDVLGNDSQEVVDYLVNFKPVAFRLEQVAKIKNLIFINDSTSTTPIALTKAIQSFKSGNIILIMGGNTKGLPYDDVVKEIANVDKVYFLKGSFSDEVKPEIGRLYPDKISAVKQELEPILNDIKKRFLGKDRQYYVLFSPGATSFAQFNNEFDRGRAFNQLINQIF